VFDAAGGLAASLPFELPPSGSATYQSGDLTGLPLPFMGSAVVSASVPVAVVAHEQRPGSDLLAYEGFVGGAPMVAAPLIFKESRGWSTILAAQNLGSIPTTVQVTYAGPSGTTSSESAVVAPLATAHFSQAGNPQLPADFSGSARVQSTNGQPLAAVVKQLSIEGAAMSYPSVSSGTERLSAPLVFKQYQGWDTGIQLFNLSAVGGTVVIRYPGAATIVESIPIAPLGSVTVYQPANLQLPAGFMGSASIQGPPGSQLAGIVNQVKTGGKTAMNHVIGSGAQAAPTLAIPLVAADADGWATGIQLQQHGPASSQLQVLFFREDGELALRLEESLASGASRTYYAPSLPLPGPGFRGSAVVQTLAGPPPIVVVNETVR
jgi:hypothetical protein